MWASGIILYILLCGFPPFVSPDNEQEPLFDAILSGVYEFPEPYWNDIGQEVRDLIANMLQLGTIHSILLNGIKSLSSTSYQTIELTYFYCELY